MSEFMFYFGFSMLLLGLGCLCAARELLECAKRQMERSDQAVARAHSFLDQTSRMHKQAIDTVIQAQKDDDDDADWWKKKRRSPWEN